jgi:hypothetical protein
VGRLCSVRLSSGGRGCMGGGAGLHGGEKCDGLGDVGFSREQSCHRLELLVSWGCMWAAGGGGG